MKASLKAGEGSCNNLFYARPPQQPKKMDRRTPHPGPLPIWPLTPAKRGEGETFGAFWQNRGGSMHGYNTRIFRGNLTTAHNRCCCSSREREKRSARFGKIVAAWCMGTLREFLSGTPHPTPSPPRGEGKAIPASRQNSGVLVHGFKARPFPRKLRSRSWLWNRASRLRSTRSPGRQPRGRRSCGSDHALPGWCSSSIQPFSARSANTASRCCDVF